MEGGETSGSTGRKNKKAFQAGGTTWKAGDKINITCRLDIDTYRFGWIVQPLGIKGLATPSL